MCFVKSKQIHENCVFKLHLPIPSNMTHFKIFHLVFLYLCWLFMPDNPCSFLCLYFDMYYTYSIEILVTEYCCCHLALFPPIWYGFSNLFRCLSKRISRNSITEIHAMNIFSLCIINFLFRMFELFRNADLWWTTDGLDW